MLLIIGSVAVGAFVAFGLYLYLSQDRMVFFPSREMETTPAEIGLVFDDVFIEVTDSVQVHAWYVPAPDGNSGSNNSHAPTVLFFHGNGGNISHRLPTVDLVVGLGANIMLVDYRGYGRSGGVPSEQNMYADALACYRWLTDTKETPSEQIMIFGRSLGGAVAIQLATQVECAGLIVESSFTSAKAMGNLMFPYFPVGLLLKHKFASIDKIKSVNCPLLVTHSKEDDMIPFQMGLALYEKGMGPKRVVEIEGLHNDRHYMQAESYRECIENILINRQFDNWD
ncbi:MAG: alpha/beta hydrolase [candidate division Zixibacteria bacterium]|nr:alpha/beta hydrolase [candidate division Zixibacteria bacterium]MDH3937107.1 alpha/beta hydrolase [candidate division Zixibacteria bacterium]MDH4033040.1 alpha/beta hydrolase [candidate division Zixibacteria bacterium]